MPRPLNRYSTVAIVLHWLIAALILANLWLGLTMTGQHGAVRLGSLQLHQSIGVTILAFSVLRLGWRLANPPPPDAPGVAHWARTASSTVHWAFYLVMIGMPLTGWLMVSANVPATPTVLYRIGDFSGVPWPHLPIAAGLSVERKRALHGAADEMHLYLSYGAYVLIALHVAGALKHQFLDPNPVLPRMLPFMKRRAPVL